MDVLLSKLRKMRKGWDYRLSPDGALLICLTGGSAHVYDASSFEEMALFGGMQNAYRCQFSPVRRTFTVKSTRSILHRFDLASGEPLPRIYCGCRNRGQDYGFCHSPNGSHLINLAMKDNLLSQMQIYEADSGRRVDVRFDGMPFVLEEIEYVPGQGRYLISGYERMDMAGENRYFALWYDLESGEYDRVNLHASASQTLYLNRHKQFLRKEQFSVTLRSEDGSLCREIVRCDEQRPLFVQELFDMMMPKKLFNEEAVIAAKEALVEDFLKKGMPLSLPVSKVRITHLSVDEDENLAFISRSDGLMIHDLKDGSSLLLPEFADSSLRIYPVGAGRVIICSATRKCDLCKVTDRA